jgi:hypothetical protein
MILHRLELSRDDEYDGEEMVAALKTRAEDFVVFVRDMVALT